MEMLDSFKIWNKSDWNRSSGIYWLYVKSLYTIQGYRTNVFEATKLLETGLWVGNICSVFDKEGMLENGIDTVISAIHGAKAVWPFSFHYERVSLRDVNDEDILLELDRILPIIHKDLMENNGVLVHCMEGRSRSVSICAAYMIKYLDHTVESALEFIKEKRSCVKPNQGYIDQLKQFEEKIKEEKSIEMAHNKKIE